MALEISPEGNYEWSYLSMHKEPNIKYGKLPAKVAEETPWKKLFVDIIDTIYLKNTYVIAEREINKFNP